jgi:hypothetical protein
MGETVEIDVRFMGGESGFAAFSMDSPTPSAGRPRKWIAAIGG